MASGRSASANGDWRGLPLGDAEHFAMTLTQIAAIPQLKEWRLGLYPGSALMPFGQAKTLAHVGRLMVFQWARDNGFDDAACTSERGVLLETSLANLFWRSKTDPHHLHTPSRQLLVYFGSSTACALEAAKRLGLETVEGFYVLADIPSDANVFRINSFELGTVRELAGRKFDRDAEFERALCSTYVQLKRAQSLDLRF